MNPAYAGYQNPRRDMGFEDYLSSSSSFASSPPHCLQRPLLIVVSNVLSSTSSPSATSGLWVDSFMLDDLLGISRARLAG
ncbi:unnamed protein product [Prunus armeniaca]